MAEPEGLFNSLPGTALNRILETFAEQGDGRALGSAACVCSTWKRAARDDLWKTACNQVDPPIRVNPSVLANFSSGRLTRTRGTSLFRPDRLARRIDAVQFDRVHRPSSNPLAILRIRCVSSGTDIEALSAGRKRPFREAYFSVDGSAHSGSDQVKASLCLRAHCALTDSDMLRRATRVLPSCGLLLRSQAEK
eukprot:2140782-Rhodomonas_salina.2